MSYSQQRSWYVPFPHSAKEEKKIEKCTRSNQAEAMPRKHDEEKKKSTKRRSIKPRPCDQAYAKMGRLNNSHEGMYVLEGSPQA